MHICDDGILVQAKPFGEGDMVAKFLTAQHGLFAGLIKGGNARRQRGSLEVGGKYSLDWRARLSESLGSMSVEAQGPSPSAQFMDDPNRLLGLQALAQVVATSLTERDPAPQLYNAIVVWIEQLAGDTWVHTLTVIELQMLSILGFGLDLSQCASTGQSQDLQYVSPRSGRAVSGPAGEPFKDRLLTLPRFLVGEVADDFDQDGLDGLALTGRFLAERVYAAQNLDLPWSRKALFDRLKANLAI